MRLHAKAHQAALLIVVAEDDDDDFMLLDTAMKDAEIPNPIVRVTDGEELLDYLMRRNRYKDTIEFPQPYMVLLDLNMPKKTGYEVLEELKKDERFRLLPIVVFTTSSAEESIKRCYKSGANSYLVKPSNYDQLIELCRSFKRYWIECAEVPEAVY